MQTGPSRGPFCFSGLARLRWGSARGAEVFDGAVIVDGEVIEPSSDAPSGTVSVPDAEVEQNGIGA